MMLRKIYILTLLGVCVYGLLFFRSGKLPDYFPGNGKIWALAWEGTRLIMVPRENTSTMPGEYGSLPVTLRPLFFQPIPINDADYELLLTIPGIGPKTADGVLQKRIQIGRFNSAEELLAIEGIGLKKARHLQKYVTFE
jgi:hypothetical protein